jgi:hypothetical protein
VLILIHRRYRNRLMSLIKAIRCVRTTGNSVSAYTTPPFTAIRCLTLDTLQGSHLGPAEDVEFSPRTMCLCHALSWPPRTIRSRLMMVLPPGDPVVQASSNHSRGSHSCLLGSEPQNRTAMTPWRTIRQEQGNEPSLILGAYLEEG